MVGVTDWLRDNGYTMDHSYVEDNRKRVEVWRHPDTGHSRYVHTPLPGTTLPRSAADQTAQTFGLFPAFG